jgi:hypothetical protein
MVNDYYTIVGVVKQWPTTENAPGVIIPLKTMKSRLGDQVISRQDGAFSLKWYELSEIWIPETPSAARLKQLKAFFDNRHDSSEFLVDTR